jgi:NADPH:quinone reductase-like Zn-dependent oxidoreductase
MRNIAIFPDNDRPTLEGVTQRICIGGIAFRCGIIHTPEPLFNRDAPEFHHKVLVKKLAFSCNYRDINLIFETVKDEVVNRPLVIGSDFVGEVVDVGSQITKLCVGDRVIGDCSYPCKVLGAHSGVPTNHASSEYEVFHQAKLIQVPTSIPVPIAAAFSICAQTTYSMIRRLCIKAGDNVLVTAARSNTSLFALNALKHRKNIHLHAVTSSPYALQKLRQLGVPNAYYYNPFKFSHDNEEILRIGAEVGGFDCILDPFADYYLELSVDMLAFEGRYITCGMSSSHPDTSLLNEQAHSLLTKHKDLLYRAIINNLSFQGNCAGRTDDLARAISDYTSGDFDVVVDSVFEGTDIQPFLERTYLSSERLGKVVYQYT